MNRTNGKKSMDQIDISELNLANIRNRTFKLSQAIVRTPTVKTTSSLINKLLDGGELYLKLECLQHSGSFKARGALSVIHSIPSDKKPAGITAASAGNHAIAAAWAARISGLSAKVVMQSTANRFRIELAKTEHAEVIIKEPGKATFLEAERLSLDEGRTFVHPFEGINTTLGTAGVGFEFIQDAPELEAVIVSVGGGGLISGVASAIKLINPNCQVYGVEPVGADAMSQSLKLGSTMTLDKIDTIADSLSPPMTLPFGYTVCNAFVDDMVTVTDDEICIGMVHFQQELKLAVEPAAAASLAALTGPLLCQLRGKKIGIVVCGANIDALTYFHYLKRGLHALKNNTILTKR